MSCAPTDRRCLCCAAAKAALALAVLPCCDARRRPRLRNPFLPAGGRHMVLARTASGQPATLGFATGGVPNV